MRGKYSPTISSAYAEDQEWFNKFCKLAPHGDVIYSQYDPDGFDSYGYNKDGVDRAGIHENDYARNDGDYDNNEDYNNAYDQGLSYWGFDGTRPVDIGLPTQNEQINSDEFIQVNKKEYEQLVSNLNYLLKAAEEEPFASAGLVNAIRSVSANQEFRPRGDYPR